LPWLASSRATGLSRACASACGGEQALGVAGHAHASDAPAERQTGFLDQTRDLAHTGDGESVVIDPVRERGVVAGEHGDPARHQASRKARHSR